MQEEPKCVHCEERRKVEMESEEINLAVLVAMVPLLVMTFFGQAGVL